MALKRLGRACYSRPLCSRPLCTSHRPSDLGVKGPDVTNLPKSLADPASRPSYPSISMWLQLHLPPTSSSKRLLPASGPSRCGRLGRRLLEEALPDTPGK